jgi:prolipoprotein diacylglyceryltransferase
MTCQSQFANGQRMHAFAEAGLKLSLPRQRLTSAFRVCGCAGLVLAGGLTGGLAIHRSLSLWVMLAIIPVAIAIFLALVMATKIIGGQERIINYHHEIAVLSGTALFLRFLHQPVLPFLDITVLGLGLFLACGRIGCLLVGCCHGRPSRWGVCYGEEYALAGFPRYYIGISLFPVQALESLWALVIVAVGAAAVLRGSTPGTVFASYIVAYGFGRFCFEFLRGDPDRAYFFGFSEAQWTSLLLMSLTLLGEASRIIPRQRWHVAATALAVLMMAGVSLHRRLRKTPTHALLHPRHVREIAAALEFAMSASDAPEPHVRVGCTSLGVRISGGDFDLSGNRFPHYAISSSAQPLTAATAAVIAAVICKLKHPRCDFGLFSGSHSVFHCLVHREARA